MELRVKHKELNDVSIEIVNNSVLLDNKIDLLLSKINELKDNWKGIDADNFYENITEYLNELKSIPVFYNDMSLLIDKMNNSYKDTDNSYLDALKKGVVLDDEYNDKR